MRFSVGDGFRFGCGFFLAVLVAQIVATIVLVILGLVGLLPSLQQLFPGVVK